MECDTRGERQWEILLRNAGSATFWGTCVTSFNADGTSRIPLFSDVSDFACSDERAVLVPACVARALSSEKDDTPENVMWLLDARRSILYGYDDEQDIHYIYEFGETV